MRKLKKVRWEFLTAILSIAIFAFIGIITKGYLSQNVIPADYPQIQPEDWADSFFKVFMISTTVCFIFNAIIIVFIGVFTSLNNKISWLVYAIINIFLMVIGPAYMSINYPADIACSTIEFLLFILEYVVVFCVSTYFGPLGFCPFRSTKIKNK